MLMLISRMCLCPPKKGLFLCTFIKWLTKGMHAGIYFIYSDYTETYAQLCVETEGLYGSSSQTLHPNSYFLNSPSIYLY